MELHEWKNTGKHFTYKNQHQIFYQTKGEGESLILIHGFPTASWDWHLLWGDLSKNFHLITLDMLGFGFSDKPAKHVYSIIEQADIWETLLEHLNVKRIKILAHDYGDTVAQEILARFLEKQKKNEDYLQVESICFLNGGLIPEMHRPRLIQKLLNSPIGFLVSKLFNEKRFRISFSEVFGSSTKPSDKELREFWQLIVFNQGHLINHKLIHYINERKKYRDRWVNALIESTIPLRLIDGPEDPVSGRHLAEKYKSIVPNADVVILENIGHYPQTESPNLVLEHFLAFIQHH